MPAYITMADLNAVIPPQFLLEALDDDSDGAADPGLFDTIVAAGMREVDAILGKRYATPFENPLPGIVQHATLVFVAEALFTRRGKKDKDNPWAEKAAGIRKQLEEIAAGKVPFTPGLDRKKPSISAITEPARTVSARGRSAT